MKTILKRSYCNKTIVWASFPNFLNNLMHELLIAVGVLSSDKNLGLLIVIQFILFFEKFMISVSSEEIIILLIYLDPITASKVYSIKGLLFNFFILIRYTFELALQELFLILSLFLICNFFVL